MGAELTGGQQRFALEYAKDGNGAAAARRAGYSHKTAKQQGSRLLTIPNVQAAVSAAVEQHFADLNLDLVRIIREAARARRATGLLHPAPHCDYIVPVRSNGSRSGRSRGWEVLLQRSAANPSLASIPVGPAGTPPVAPQPRRHGPSPRQLKRAGGVASTG